MRNAACFVAMLIFAASASHAQTGGSDSDLFPRPPALADAVAFWTRVYTEVDTNGGFVHDDLDLGVVYGTVRFGPDASPRQRRRASRDAIDRYRKILNDLADGNDGAMTTEVARVRALWPADTSSAAFRAAAGRLRFQLGQADRYRAGLVRSGRWKPYILSVLDASGLPPELAALPHVESSFDPTAYSKVGAAGMWQFTRSTGLRYMQIDHIIDERRDPFLATDAAARLLADNFAVIESWPLALTAYNHGLAGMRRAAAQLGTKDIGTIVERYNGRTFGFASRNFYAAFLAALDVERDAEKFFGPLAIDGPEELVVVELPDYIDAAPLARALGLAIDELRRMNPALTDTVWAGEKYVPRGFPLRVPGRSRADLVARLDSIPGTERFADQRPDVQHRVRRGETLSGIADRYRVSLTALVRANGLNNRNFIREGQVLNLPVAAGAPVPVAVASAALASGEYVVRPGDSVDAIARRLGVDQTALLGANRIADRNRIYPGQVLRLPGAADDSPAPPVEAVAATLAALPAPVERSDTAAAVREVDVATIEDSAIGDTPAVAADDVAAIVAADADEAEADLESNVLASTQATLAGDPSDYTVAADGTIEVQAMETLGHYADWLGIRTQRLRDINGMPFGEAVVYGQRIKLTIADVDVATFEARRQRFHEQRQETFFSSHQIDEVVEHVVSAGESLWLLALRTYEVPVWLLRQYNPDLDLDRVNPGTVVKFPRLRSIATELAGIDGGRNVG